MQELKQLKHDHDLQLRKLWKLEESKDDNRKAYRKIEQEETDFDVVNRELNLMITDMPEHWKGAAYFREIDIFEETVTESSRDIRESMAERKEELDRQIKVFSQEEEECREELRRIKLRIEEE